MNEEIRNNEIQEKELENVSGGASAFPTHCPKCGEQYVLMFNEKTGMMDRLFCLKCKK